MGVDSLSPFMKFVLLALIFSLSSCSYQWGNQGQRLPGGYKKIAVPVFRNNTSEQGIESFFTNAILKRLSQSSVFEITNMDGAEVILEGNIEKIVVTRSGDIDSESKLILPDYVVLSSTNTVELYVSLVLRHSASGKSLWQSSFVTSVSYKAAQVGAPVINSINPLYNKSARSENLALAAEDLMASAYSRLTESF